MRGWWGNYDIFIYFCGGTKQEHIYILSDVYLKYSIKQLLGGKSTIALLKTHSQAIRAVTLYEPLKSLRAILLKWSLCKLEVQPFGFRME